MNPIYVEELEQSYTNDGNVFLRFATITGEVDVTGKDIKRTPVTLIVPMGRLTKLAENLDQASSAYQLDIHSAKKKEEVKPDTRKLGRAIPIPE